MKAPELVKIYYDELKARHYKPLEVWGRDGKWAKKFLDSGRTDEDFRKLLHKALIGPKHLQMAVCKGLHVFMTVLPEIELLGEAPWEPSAEERAANIKLAETAISTVIEKFKVNNSGPEPDWVKNPRGGWIRNPRKEGK